MPSRPVAAMLEEIEFLFEKYSQEKRTTTQPYLLDAVQKSNSSYSYHPDDEVVRETLIEHVGSLPMLAAAIFPYIEDNEVDLGEALKMLAIHDIGELKTGDEMTFTKKNDSKDAEYAAPIELLHPRYHDLYDQVENQTNKSAQFAKSIDKINPDILDYLTPVDITIWRYQYFTNTPPDGIIDLITKHKRPYMLWSPFMTELHDYLLSELDKKIRKAIDSK